MFGPDGQLIEIFHEDDQNFVVDLMIAAETSFNYSCNPGTCIPVTWWTGLQVVDNNHTWMWNGSKSKLMNFVSSIPFIKSITNSVGHEQYFHMFSPFF